jgi:hypothetical protein
MSEDYLRRLEPEALNSKQRSRLNYIKERRLNRQIYEVRLKEPYPQTQPPRIFKRFQKKPNLGSLIALSAGLALSPADQPDQLQPYLHSTETKQEAA